MIKSMTAFGRAKLEGEKKDITIEIKSVNSRFFDCSVKMPRVYTFLEERIKNYVQRNAISRGKVDVKSRRYRGSGLKSSTEGASADLTRDCPRDAAAVQIFHKK